MRPVYPEERNTWDDLVSRNGDGGNMLQGACWAAFKEKWGWKAERFIDDPTATAVLVLTRNIPIMGRIAYIPKGPGCALPGELGRMVRELMPLLPHCVAVQVEPEWDATDVMRKALEREGFIKSAVDVQLTHATMVVELSGSMEDIRARYRPKGRYNLGVAKRHGVHVAVTATPTQQELDALDELVDITNDRAQYTVRRAGYLQSSWQEFLAASKGFLALAYFNDEPVAGAFVTILGNKAWYKDGGSSRNHREVMAPYLLHDTIIEQLLTMGITSYDLGSVPPPDEVNEHHALYGLYRFKKAFGARHDTYVGTWDFPVKRQRYLLWRQFIQKLVSRLYVSIRHMSWY